MAVSTLLCVCTMKDFISLDPSFQAPSCCQTAARTLRLHVTGEATCADVCSLLPSQVSSVSSDTLVFWAHYYLPLPLSPALSLPLSPLSPIKLSLLPLSFPYIFLLSLPPPSSLFSSFPPSLFLSPTSNSLPSPPSLFYPVPHLFLPVKCCRTWRSRQS